MSYAKLPDLAYAYGGPGMNGRIRVRPEDFHVSELLRFEPDDTGSHWLLHIEKKNCNTIWVQQQLAEFAGIRRMDVGFAGMKDRRAVCEQWFSVLQGSGKQLDWDKLDVDGVRVIAARQHGRKLRRGTLRGNEFRIVVRDTEGDREVLDRTLAKIVDEGVPNYFGPQRFGHNAANISLAQAVLGKENRRVNRQKRQFALSAARSLIFNAVLSARVTAGTWSEILEGDLAGLVGSRSFFPVKELTDEIRVWAQKKDIHPTGPLWGTGVRDTSGSTRDLESKMAHTYETLSTGLERQAVKQSRRSSRLLVEDLRWKYTGDKLTLEFFLRRGGYATAVLREILNVEEPDAGLEESENND